MDENLKEEFLVEDSANIILSSSLAANDSQDLPINKDVVIQSSSNVAPLKFRKGVTELFKKALAQQLESVNSDNTLQCYSAQNAHTIANTFEAQLLNAASLPEQCIQYINFYPEAAVKLLVGEMDPSSDLKLPLKPTGLTGLMHTAIGKRVSGGWSWGGVCSSASVPSGARPLFEIDLKKAKSLNDNMVKEFIRNALSGVEYIIDQVPSRGLSSQPKDIALRDLQALSNPVADQLTFGYHNASVELALKHIFDFKVGGESHQSIMIVDIAPLYNHLMLLMPAVFNELKQWEIDIIASYSYRWAGLIAGEPQIIAGQDIKTTWFGNPQIQFTKLLAFTFSEFFDAQKLRVKIPDENGYYLRSGYRIKASEELIKKNDGLIAQIVASSHVACEMLAPLFIAEARRNAISFDSDGLNFRFDPKAWFERPKPSALNNNDFTS